MSDERARQVWSESENYVMTAEGQRLRIVCLQREPESSEEALIWFEKRIDRLPNAPSHQ